MKKTRYMSIIAIVLCLLFMLIACVGSPANEAKVPAAGMSGANISSESPEPPEPKVLELTDPAESEEQEQPDYLYYPIEIITFNFEGEEVITVYERAPQRVLAVYQGSIETMIALGLEDHVIASFGLDNEIKEEWQEGFSRMNYIDTSFAPDRETVIMLQPDLILTWGSLFNETRLGDVDYWHSRGTNTYINTNTRRGGTRVLENEFNDLLNIGRIFNVEYRAEALVAQMREDIKTARAAVEAQDERPLVAVITVRENDIRNYGMELAGDIITSIGLDTVKSETNAMGKEDIVVANPDVIFLEYMPRLDLDADALRLEILSTIYDNPAFANINAVLNGRVYTIMLGEIFAPAARTGDGIRTIVNGLFPGLLD